MLKIGIIGTNFISDRFCEAADLVNGVSVSAVYSRAAESGEAFIKKHNIDRAYHVFSDFLGSDIDAVYVASPNFMHKEQTVAALRAGKHVLCEKMMANNRADVLEMINAARETDRVLLEAMRPDFDKSYEVVLSALPRLGRIRRAHLEFCQYSSRYDRFKAGELTNAFDPAIGNSALADIGIYPLHFAISLFGEPTEITASAVLLENGFEGMGALTMNYGDMFAEIVYSKITDSRTPSVIEGELGSLIIDKISAPTRLTLLMRDGREEVLDFTPAKNNMVYEIEAFCRMIAGKDSPDKYLGFTLASVSLVNRAHSINGAAKHLKLC